MVQRVGRYKMMHAVDLGKYLHYANAEMADWINTTKIERFLKLLEWPGLKAKRYLAEQYVHEDSHAIIILFIYMYHDDPANLCSLNRIMLAPLGLTFFQLASHLNTW